MDPKSKKPSPPVHNSVRMDIEKLNELFEDMERRSPTGQQDPRRSHVRWPFRQMAVPMKIMHTSGGSGSVHVACRNISAGGMSVLHSSFLHTGTRVITTLPHVSGHTIEVEGTIVRCSHIQGVCHELGIKFKNAADARNFVKLNPFEDGFVLEKVTPESLVGTIVHVDDSALGQSLVAHFLRETRTRLKVAQNFVEAKRLIDEGVDLIICDYFVKGQNGAEFIATLREQGSTVPVIIITSDASEETRTKLLSAQASAILTKPVSQALMLRALAEFMSADKDVGGTVSNLPANHPNAPMLERFVKEVRDQAGELEKAILAKNIAQTRNVVLQVAGIAPIMGFPKLAQLAQSADLALSTATNVDDAKAQLKLLVKTCRDVKLARAG